MADLAKRHIEEHARIKNKPRSVKRAQQLWDRCILPRFGKRRVAHITRADVARIMTEMADTPAMANKVLSLLSKSFNLAEVWGWRPEGTNPCRHIDRYREESRERYLSESELQRLDDVLAKIDAERSALPQAVAAIRLLILTGCRSAEILKLEWDEAEAKHTEDMWEAATARVGTAIGHGGFPRFELADRMPVYARGISRRHSPGQV